MSHERSEVHVESPLSGLERSIIDEFVRARGHDPHNLTALGDEERQRLLKEASVYASGRLMEVEARSHFLDEIHNDVAKAGGR